MQHHVHRCRAECTRSAHDTDASRPRPAALAAIVAHRYDQASSIGSPEQHISFPPAKEPNVSQSFITPVHPEVVSAGAGGL